jgi:hypothetical protein
VSQQVSSMSLAMECPGYHQHPDEFLPDGTLRMLFHAYVGMLSFFHACVGIFHIFEHVTGSSLR